MLHMRCLSSPEEKILVIFFFWFKLIKPSNSTHFFKFKKKFQYRMITRTIGTGKDK